jgi:hypothetical protein
LFLILSLTKILGPPHHYLLRKSVIFLHSVYLYFTIAATANRDFLSIHKTLTLPPGSGDEASVCLNITIIEDNFIEGNEWFRVRRYSPYNGNSGVGPGGYRYLTATIIDNDSAYNQESLLV